VTQDEALIAEVRQRHQAVLPDMAGFAVEELEARIAKVEPIFQELGQEATAVQVARQRLTEGRQALDRKDWGAACRLAEEGLGILRAAQHRVWQEICGPELTEVGLKMIDFYLLPRFAKDVKALQKALKADAWGPNQLPNGSFESDSGWSGAKLVHDAKGKAGFVSDVSHSGKRSLRLMSDSLATYQGKEWDWVTVNLVSDKILAKPGEAWEIAAWVRVPKKLEKTERGVTVSLFVYDDQGKIIPKIGGQDREARQVEAAGEWKRLRIVLHLHSPQAAAIAARVALCGIGEAYVDDVTVRRLEVEKQE